MAKTRTYTLFLDHGVRLVMRTDRTNGAWISSESEDDACGAPGEVIAVHAAYDLEDPATNLRAHRIARAFGIEAVIWDAIPDKLPEPPSTTI